MVRGDDGEVGSDGGRRGWPGSFTCAVFYGDSILWVVAGAMQVGLPLWTGIFGGVIEQVFVTPHSADHMKLSMQGGPGSSRCER